MTESLYRSLFVQRRSDEREGGPCGGRAEGTQSPRKIQSIEGAREYIEHRAGNGMRVTALRPLLR